MSNKVPTTFTVPDTIEGVTGLLTARKWEKAAIVYAWTLPEESGGRPKKSGEKSPLLNISEFADKGISGLTDRITVRLYRNAWVWAIEHNLAEPVAPGDDLDLGDLALVDFPPTDQGSYTAATEYDDDYAAEAYEVGVSVNAAKRTGANKAAIAAAIKADPEVEKAAWKAIQEKADKKAATGFRERGVIIDPQPKPTGGTLGDYLSTLDALLEAGKRLDAIKAVRDMQFDVKAAMNKLLDECGYIGREKEVVVVRAIWAAAQETALLADNLIVETGQEAQK